MADPSSVAPYLPTLELARQQALPVPPGEPFERHSFCALLVLARTMRSERWEQRRTVPWRDAAPLQGIAPTDERVEGSTRTRVERRLVEIHPCAFCVRAAKKVKLRSPCPSCTADVVVTRTVDKLMGMRETYVPSELTAPLGLFHFERTLESAIPRTPPECLRCHDLRPQAVSTAYRGGGLPQPPTFHGHEFGDTIDQGRAALDAFLLGGSELGYEVRVYAWPLLWLRYGDEEPTRTDYVLYADGGAVLRCFVGAAVER